MKKLSKIFVVCATCLPFTLKSQDYSFTNGNFYIKPLVGTEFALSGNVVNASTYSQTAATTLDFADGTIVTAAATGTVDVPDVSFGDAFEQPLSWGGEIGYYLTDDVNVYFKVNKVDADSEVFTAASANVNATVTFNGSAQNFTAGGNIFEASFSDYEEVNFMFGANKNFSFDNFSLYFGGGLGFATIDGLDMTVFELVSGSRNSETIKFSKDSTVFSGELNTGVYHTFSNNFSVGLDANYRYKGAPSQDNTDFNNDNLDTLESANDAEGQHVFGLMGSISYRF